MILLLAVVFAPRASVRAPVPLSADPAPVRVDSSYGCGHFGSWFVDGFGLPAFRYDVDDRVARLGVAVGASCTLG